MSGASFENVLSELLRRIDGPARPEHLMLRGEPAPILLVFEPGEDAPVCVFKGARDLSTISGEYEKIATLREVAPEGFRETLPQPLGMHSDEPGPTGVLLSVLPGSRLKDLPPELVFGTSTIDETLGEITRWLFGYHEIGGRLHQEFRTTGRLELIERPVERYLTWFRVTGDERDGLYKLIVINPRPWAILEVSVDAGVNIPLLYYKLAQGESVEPTDEFRENQYYIRLIWGNLDIPEPAASLSMLLFGQIGLGEVLSVYGELLAHPTQLSVDVGKLIDPVPTLSALYCQGVHNFKSWF